MGSIFGGVGSQEEYREREWRQIGERIARALSSLTGNAERAREEPRYLLHEAPSGKILRFDTLTGATWRFNQVADAWDRVLEPSPPDDEES